MTTSAGPLAGLRVLDATDDLGRFATKLLAEAGASVAQLRRERSPGRTMVDPTLAERGGVLDWWHDGGKIRIAADADDPEAITSLAAQADLFIESMPPGRLHELGVDHDRLIATNPRLTHVSLTPFGRTGPWANWQGSDLVAGALGGVCSITGDADRPLTSWGGQNDNFAGFMAAVCGLAGVRRARETGRGGFVDLSAHEVVAGSIENLMMQWFFDDVLPLPKRAQRQGSLHWLGAYLVAPAATGNVMITPTPQTANLVDWMIEEGTPGAERFAGAPVEELLEQMPELMAVVRSFIATKDAGELFVEAQGRHVAFGEVQSLAQAADNPQFAFRELYSGTAEADDGSMVAPRPSRLARLSATPFVEPKPPPVDNIAPDELVREWKDVAADLASPTPPSDSTEGADAKPLAGLRIADFTWVLAGPFATRILGDLGADVIKIQTEERATLVNTPTYPYYFCWNRSKRSLTADLKRPEALAAVRSIIEQSDVLIENYSAGVFDRLGLGYEEVKSWNPDIIYVSMAGCGHEGPWKDIISYAPTIHALCGLTHLTNPSGRGDVGCGFSLNDHAAGFAAVFAVLSCLEARRSTGAGQYVDLAQLEIGSYLLGPGLLDLMANGHEAQPDGNADALAGFVPNEIYRCSDGGYLAVTVRTDAEWARLCQTIGADDLLEDAQLRSVEGRRTDRDRVDQALGAWAMSTSANDGMHLLQGAGIPAGKVQDAEDLAEHDPQLAAREFWQPVDHAVFGERVFDRFPALWDGADLGGYLPSPYWGEHNFDILSDIAGLSVEDIAEGIGGGIFQ